MIAIQLENIKGFMGKLLLSEMFDRFDVTEAAITTFGTVHIDGHFQKEYYTAEELEQLGYESKVYSHWGQVRPFCFELIKGKHTPLQLKIVFRLSDGDTSRLLTENALSYRLSDINGLFLNIRYDGTSLQAVTGTSMKLFTMDKSLEHAWDETAQKMLAIF